MTDASSVTREVKIAAPADVVFSYFTDIEKVVRWKAQEGDLDARADGSYRLRIGGDYWAEGRFVEIDRPRRLVYTWGWEGNELVPPGSTTVEVTFEQSGDYTIVRLTHRGLPTPETLEQHTQGWEHYLSRLSVASSGGDPGPDPWAEGPPA